MESNTSLKEQAESLYKHHKTLFFHAYFAIVWPIVIWLMYLNISQSNSN